MKKPAFTMLELVFAIVVIGILASLAMPRIDRDIRQEAADNILSAIRYTQHLALMDDKTNPSKGDWQKAFWQIRFSNPDGIWLYTVGSNSDLVTNIDKNESAIDPTNGKYMHGTSKTQAADESPNIFLTKKYGVNGMDIRGCSTKSPSSSMHIAFDHLGRPHRGVTQGGANDYHTYVTSDCLLNFSFENGDDNLTIKVYKETGYAQIAGQPDS